MVVQAVETVNKNNTSGYRFEFNSIQHGPASELIVA
jgi:hypothetical protein